MPAPGSVALRARLAFFSVASEWYLVGVFEAVGHFPILSTRGNENAIATTKAKLNTKVGRQDLSI